jgi:sugar lactone lactonase YvrE
LRLVPRPLSPKRLECSRRFSCYPSGTFQICALFAVGLTCAAAFAQQPRIDRVSPSQGPIRGGTIVTIAGENFRGATVRLDREVVAPLTLSDSEIQLRMPPHDNGYVVISVRNETAAAYREYLYIPPTLHRSPPGFITTVAGVGSFTRDYGAAVDATLSTPWSLDFDRDGNLFVPDAAAGRVYVVTPDARIHRFAGGGAGADLGDGGSALDALLVYPRDIAVDGAGNVYIGGDSCRVRKVDRAGVITTIAGDGNCRFSGDGGAAAVAGVGQPTYLAADADDLFFIDFQAMRIRRIHFADGSISTFAGNGTIGFSGDGGLATNASFHLQNNDVGALAMDPHGHLFLSDDGNGRIRRIDRATGIITTFYVPTPGLAAPDGVATVRSLAFDRAGNLYYGGSGRIVKVSATGEFLTSWGVGGYALPVDGASAATTPLGHDIGLAIDPTGNIVYSDDAIGRVRRIDVTTGTIQTVAGIGPATIAENGPAIATVAGIGTEGSPLAFSPSGELLVGDTGTFRLRRLGRNGLLTTIAGTGACCVGSRVDGVTATQVALLPVGFHVDHDGAIDVTMRSTFMRIAPNGAAYGVGNPNPDCAYGGDGGVMAAARFCQAWDVARDSSGNLFVADTNNNRIRRVDARTGIVTTVVGSGGPVNGHERYGFGRSCGDGGLAIDACINTPYGITFDDQQNLLIAEWGGIRKVDSTGVISTLSPHAATKILFHRGFVYSARGDGVWRISRTGRITRLAGAPSATLLGDGGPALDASIIAGGQAAGVAIDEEGNVFFSDVGHRRIRAIRFGAVLAAAGVSVEATTSGSTIRATVRDALGEAAESVRVDFAAPPTGATCALTPSFAITDKNGVATVTCVPTCTAGTYSVTARPLNATATVSVTLTNSPGPCRRRAVRH